VAGISFGHEIMLHHGGTCAVLAEVVPFEFGCLATTDPATGLLTGAVKTGPTDMGDEEFAF